MMRHCSKCGHSSEDLSGFCSLTENLICQGRHPLDGCGAVLTAEERHYYGDVCESCEGEWLDRVEHWRHGDKDKILDDVFGVTESLH